MISLDAGGFDWSHVSETVVGSVTVGAMFFIAFWGFHRQDKADRKKKAEEERTALTEAAKELEQKQEERHEENQRVLGNITTLLRFVPPHRHRERNGNLTADGIDYGPQSRD